MLSVWFAKKENILVYPIGLISVGLYVLICFFAKLYADAFINLYYFIISIFGWYYWMYGRKFQSAELDTSEKKAVIIRSSFKENIILIFLTLLLFVGLGFLLQNFTDSNVPWADAFNTSIFIIAMYLMAKKNIYHWIFWIVGDLASIPLYIYKNLNVTAFQYLIFLLIAIAGYIEWRKKLNAQVHDAST
ncbi:MAG: nicotinamide mononucleotide transporter [Bacteroidetes bacterium]|nr:nicotinamide mononucleotide transporter [Bacteroidota bacterium]